MNESLLKIVGLMFAMYDKEPSPEVMAMYVKILSDFELEAVKKAVNRAVRECEFCPKPKNLLNFLKPSDEDLRSKARLEWEKVRVSSESGSEVKELRNDPITELLVKGKYAINRLEGTPLKDMPFVEKDFIATYVDFQKSDAVKGHIELGKGTTSTLVIDLANKLTLGAGK